MVPYLLSDLSHRGSYDSIMAMDGNERRLGNMDSLPFVIKLLS
jgi:hypothetical protein